MADFVAFFEIVGLRATQLQIHLWVYEGISSSSMEEVNYKVNGQYLSVIRCNCLLTVASGPTASDRDGVQQSSSSAASTPHQLTYKHTCWGIFSEVMDEDLKPKVEMFEEMILSLLLQVSSVQGLIFLAYVQLHPHGFRAVDFNIRILHVQFDAF